MNILTSNIRGIRVSGKGSWIKGIKIQEGASFVAMQEIQSSGVSEDVLRGFWGNSSMEFEVVDPCRRSGGLVSI